MKEEFVINYEGAYLHTDEERQMSTNTPKPLPIPRMEFNEGKDVQLNSLPRQPENSTFVGAGSRNSMTGDTGGNQDMTNNRLTPLKLPSFDDEI